MFFHVFFQFSGRTHRKCIYMHPVCSSNSGRTHGRTQGRPEGRPLPSHWHRLASHTARYSDTWLADARQGAGPQPMLMPQAIWPCAWTYDVGPTLAGPSNGPPHSQMKDSHLKHSNAHIVAVIIRAAFSSGLHILPAETHVEAAHHHRCCHSTHKQRSRLGFQCTKTPLSWNAVYKYPTTSQFMYF